MAAAHEPMPTMTTWGELLELVRRETMLAFRVCLPARVVEWVPPTNGPRPTPPRARVRVDLKWARVGAPEDVEEGVTYVPPDDPSQPGELVGEYAGGSLLVPVHFPGAWGSWSRGPLLKGETGKLVFADRSLDTWQIDGGVGDPIDPVFDHLHGFNLHDAFFEPGVRSGRMMSATSPGPSQILADAHQIGLADGSAGLTIRLPSGDETTRRNIALTTTGRLVNLDAALGKVVAGNPATSKAVALAPQLLEVLDALHANLLGWAPTDPDGLALKALLSAPGVGFLPLYAALKGQIVSAKLEAG